MVFSIYHHYVRGCNHVCDNFRKSWKAPRLFPSQLLVSFLVNLTRSIEGEVKLIVNIVIIIIIIIIIIINLFSLLPMLL